MPDSWILLDISLALAGAIIILRFLTKGPPAPLPPGPRALPIIGNLLDMPKDHEWVKFSEWAKQYGDLVDLVIFGQHYMIVNSVTMAGKMLEKKSHKYSERPILQMGGELIGWKDILTLLPYGPRFRNHRKMFHQVIGTPAAMTRFHHIKEYETHRFLKSLLASPDDLLSHIRKTAAAIILRISHGYEVQEGTDPFVSLADAALEQFSLSTSPGAFLVNLVPALQYLPDWFPGAGFKKTAREWRKTLNYMVEGPFQFVTKSMEEGTARTSMASQLLRNAEALSADEVHDIKWATATVYAGASDTTVATIYSFFKAMILYPEVQAKAQAELDHVIGADRLPTIADRERLPFVSALAMEALRWHVVAPTGFAHSVRDDDLHDGYFIPKGSIVIPNLWYMAHDPRSYYDPMKFNPDRFVRTKDHEPELDPREIIFGFGRRICPGRLFADASVFLTCAMALAAFNIGPHMEDGKPVIPDVKQGTGIISHPSVFKCTITPRSSRVVALINTNPTLE